jgi:lipoprotein-releasing system permease protein
MKRRPVLSFELWLAWRYLRARRRGPLPVITLISVAAVAAGVATLVIALAVTSGFRRHLEGSLLGATPHINLLRTDGEGIANWRELIAAVEKHPQVLAAAPSFYGKVLVASGRQSEGIVLKGVDPERETRMGELLSRLREGSARALSEAGADPPLMVGRYLADSLAVHPGDMVTVTSPRGRLSPLGPVARYKRFRVAGVFDTGYFDFDAQWAVTTLAATQELFMTGDVASAVGVKVRSLYRAAEIAEELKAAAGPGLGATNWMDQNRSLFNALRLEKTVTALTLGLIVFVAALGIFNRLYVLVLEKTRDIAVLMSLGARRRQVSRIFQVQGLLIGALGTTSGLLVGYLLAWMADRYHWIRLEADIYSMSYVPFDARIADGLLVSAAALLISYLATLYPARSAAAVAPAEALRYE